MTTANVSSTAHGFAPKSPADATQFLNGAATPAFAAVKDSDLSTSDITTNNVSTTKHGFAPKLPNDATKYLDGTGAYSVPAGGGSGALTKISTLSGNGTSGLLDFTSIAGTYSALRILVVGRSDAAAASDDCYIRFNGDTAGNYDWTYVRGSNAAASSANTEADTNGIYCFVAAASTATASVPGTFIIEIPFYAGTTFHKQALISMYAQTSTAAAGPNRVVTGGNWRSTSAITQVTVRLATGKWITGSTAILYGIS